MTANRRISAASIIGNTVVREKGLSIGIILTVTGAVVISLFPPLVLGKIIDRIAGEISRDFPWQRSIFC